MEVTSMSQRATTSTPNQRPNIAKYTPPHNTGSFNEIETEKLLF